MRDTGLDPVLEKLEVQHPKPGESMSIRVVNVNDDVGPFGRFQYELPHEDKKYLEMQKEIDEFYSRMTQMQEGHVEFSLIKSGVPVIVRYYDGSFKRAELLWDLIEGQVDFIVSIGLLDENLPVMTVRLKNLYYLDRRFGRISPRKRFFSLQELELYKDVSCFRRIILGAREDFFTGALEAEFVENGDSTEIGGCSKRDSATVSIRGVRYPKDRFPLGLNGLLIEMIYEMMKEPGVPEVNFKRREGLLIGGSNGGDVFISFYTFTAVHLLNRIDKVNNGEVNSIELLEKFKVRVDSPLSRNVMYLALYVDDGLYYRAKYLSPAKTISEDKMVDVVFIDYGTIQAVCVKDLVLASKVDYLLGIFPPQAIKVHLAGVEYMDSERLAEIISPLDFCIIKTVRAAGSTNLAEVEIRRQQSSESRFRSINQEIVDRIGNRQTEACLMRIHAFANLWERCPDIKLNRTNTTRCHINSHIIVWSNVGDPLEILLPDHEFVVKIGRTNKLDSVVLFPMKRRYILEQLEKELLQKNSNHKRSITFFELQANDCFGYWWQKKNKMTRIRISESLENVMKVKPYEVGSFKEVKVFLIDYGITKLVRLDEISLLQEQHCRYPPFAVLSTIIAPKALSPSDPKASDHQRLIDGKIFKARVENLSFDLFDVPHATVKLLDFDPTLIPAEPNPKQDRGDVWG